MINISKNVGFIYRLGILLMLSNMIAAKSSSSNQKNQSEKYESSRGCYIISLLTVLRRVEQQCCDIKL